MIFFLLALALIGFYIMSLYNKLVRSRNAYKNAFSQIDVQLQRRFDLIPNLVEIAQKYMSHEREALENVILARNGAHAALNVAKKQSDEISLTHLAQAETKLDLGLSRLFALSESYPDLKANTTMMQLSEEVASTENKVSFARQSYNDAVMSYNNAVQEFPSSAIAGPFGFTQAPFYKKENEEASKPVQIKFD